MLTACFLLIKITKTLFSSAVRCQCLPLHTYTYNHQSFRFGAHLACFTNTSYLGNKICKTSKLKLVSFVQSDIRATAKSQEQTVCASHCVSTGFSLLNTVYCWDKTSFNVAEKTFQILTVGAEKFSDALGQTGVMVFERLLWHRPTTGFLLII